MSERASQKREWTEAQKRGITTTGRSLLVSAAAGSGKTSVLAARCVHLVCDAPSPCAIDDLLVVTFTEAAAAQMKSRIHSALRERAEQHPSERLTGQLALVDQAQVSTLHGFCSRLLRQHFHLAGLDPGFDILDQDDAQLLRLEIARELFRKRYEDENADAFRRFIDDYGDGNDERLLRRVISTHDLLSSLVHPQGWLDDARRRLRDAAEEPLERSDLGRQLRAMISDGLVSLGDRCLAARRQLGRLKGFDKYEHAVTELGRTVKYWRETFEGAGIDALAEVAQDLQLPALPSFSNSLPNKDLAKSIVDAVRNDMKSGSWCSALRFTTRQWQDGLIATLPHAEVFLNLVEQFGHGYRRVKDAVRVLDFADLERFTLKVLRDEKPRTIAPSAAACLCHQRYAHVLVDEYQDINEVQDAILSLVSRECLVSQNGERLKVHQPPNLFCVGDVKQSIYRFRLAEPARFIGKMDQYRGALSLFGAGDGEVIDLQANFRSRAPLLDAINGVFERLMTKEAADIAYDASHRLIAKREFPSQPDAGTFAGSPIELHLLTSGAAASRGCDEDSSADDQELDRTEREALFVAHRIRQIMGMPTTNYPAPTRMQVMDKGTNLPSPRPIRFGDIVILLRSMRYKAEQFARILDLAGIPVHADSSTGYFESMEVRDMLSLLHLLDNQRQDIPMAAVLRSPLAGIAQPEDALARIHLAYRSEPEGVPFHDAAVRYANEKDDELAARLRDFFIELKAWREISQRRPLDELIWHVYQHSGYLAFCSGLPGGRQRAANLLSLHERAAQFGTFQRQGLSRFLQFLESLRAEADMGMPSVAGEADDVVRVMSIHRSKGQEFPVVILPDLGKLINFQDCRGAILVDRKAGLGMSVVDEPRQARYPSLASTLVERRLKQQSIAEELRVLYVAMTRAEEHLICVGTCAETAPAAWLSRWGSHRGPLPCDAILGAGTMLDWIGPVDAASRKAGSPIFDLQIHGGQDIAAWASPIERRPDLTERQEQLAALKPLEPAPAPSKSADQIIGRFSFQYPHRAFVGVPASQSVTTRSKSGITPALSALPEPVDAELLKSVPHPRFFVPDARPAAAERGTATHLVLQHLHLARTCDRDDIAAQIVRLIDRKVISPTDAAMVDHDAIAWVIGSEVGKLMRQHAAILRREIPVCFPADPEISADAGAAPDPLDRIMVRGRLDVVIPLSSGSIIIDYKTDRVSGPALDARADEYRGQMNAYRKAFAEISKMPVGRVCLLFLTPRQIVEA